MRVKNIKHGQNEAKNMIKIKKIINDYLYQSNQYQYNIISLKFRYFYYCCLQDVFNCCIRK